MGQLAETALKCPECGSDKNFKDGTRPLSNGETAQRYLCRALANMLASKGGN